MPGASAEVQPLQRPQAHQRGSPESRARGPLVPAARGFARARGHESRSKQLLRSGERTPVSAPPRRAQSCGRSPGPQVQPGPHRTEPPPPRTGDPGPSAAHPLSPSADSATLLSPDRRFRGQRAFPVRPGRAGAIGAGALPLWARSRVSGGGAGGTWHVGAWPREAALLIRVRCNLLAGPWQTVRAALVPQISGTCRVLHCP